MIVLLDIGKTNKKCFVFDEDYRIVFEQTTQLPETVDADGDPCEDLDGLQQWVTDALQALRSDERFQIKAVNVTTYGASFVHLDAEGRPLTPLYNYLKPFPEDLKKRFFDTYGGEEKIALETASPVLGMLNSGLQLYWLKHKKPLIFKQIKWSLHLPQYIAFLVSKHLSAPAKTEDPVTELTSIGCHTMLWDFQKHDYHDWVKAEGITEKFPPLAPGIVRERPEKGPGIRTGTGLHDSSAALIPYLAGFEEPFVLISTGTWCISLNPFHQEPLRPDELANDGLFYLSYAGKPVKAARYFGGNQHETFTKGLAQAFDKPLNYYQQLPYDLALLENFHREKRTWGPGAHPFENYETAYHVLMSRIIERQYYSTKMVLTKTTRRIFVDGGFSKNEIYMRHLANVFPDLEVYAAEVAQATALGAALAMHSVWNAKPQPQNLISLKKYTASAHEIGL